MPNLASGFQRTFIELYGLQEGLTMPYCDDPSVNFDVDDDVDLRAVHDDEDEDYEDDEEDYEDDEEDYDEDFEDEEDDEEDDDEFFEDDEEDDD